MDKKAVEDKIAENKIKIREVALAMLGLTVLLLQLFEKGFAIVFHTHSAAVRLGDALQGDTEIGEPNLKMPLMSFVNELKKKGRINEALETRLREFADKRHEIVHRWINQNGWPEVEDSDRWAELAHKCHWVSIESAELTSLLSGLMTQEEGESNAQHSQRLTELFKVAGAAQQHAQSMSGLTDTDPSSS